MSGLIPGFEYDIFISYRQKDNKGDKWVNSFVEALKRELEATFKEDISIYFDENPHDRLQETHDVRRSLEGKLKCLIFIPILSRTYCDPASYAWQYELLPFIKYADDDRFGRNIKLKNGNYASRILPIRIHDLEQEDIKLFEEETGSVLRSLDFVFKTSAGVNRPLKESEDHPNDNINKTYFSDQINKVAITIKDVISGLKSGPSGSLKEMPPSTQQPEKGLKDDNSEKEKIGDKLKKRRLFSGILSIAVLIFIFLAYQRIADTRNEKIQKDPDGKISIAVNTLDNLTGDTALNPWRQGISELLIYNLANSKELSVQNSQTMYDVYQTLGHSRNASVVPSLSREAAFKLKAGNYITGNIQKAGNKIRIIVKLIDTGTDELLWTGKVDGHLNSEYIDLADSLSQKLKDFLEIKVLEKKVSLDFREAFTNSSDAYRKYIEGTQLFMQGEYLQAVESLKEAYQLDTTFTLAAFYTANSYNMLATYSPESVYSSLAIEWTQKSVKGKERLPDEYQLWVEMWRAFYITRNSAEVLKYLSQLEKSDIKSRYYWFDIGVTYSSSFEMWEKASGIYEKIEKISLDWGDNWKFREYYRHYGQTLFKLGRYAQSERIYLTGLKCFPEWGPFYFCLARSALVTNDTVKAAELIKKRISIAKEAGWTKAEVESMLAQLYTDANLLDEAEKHFRNILIADPGDYWGTVNFAAFLIYYNRNINEGMSLAEKALKISPDGSFGLWTIGYGYYMEGKYNKALDYLVKVQQSSQSINPLIEKQIQIIRDSISNQK